MSSANDQSTSQSDFFSHSREQHSLHPDFNEICNALYERELANLAHRGPTQISLLKRRLGGLPHHVRRIAYYLSNNQTPLAIDSHNGSWQARQAASCPGKHTDKEKSVAWFSKHAAHGLVVGVWVGTLNEEHIELDSVDKVQKENHTLHLNKHGWFTFEGDFLDHEKSDFDKRQMLKPTKSVMQAACCGHSWNHKGKISPRPLSLREMLLSMEIEWKNFTLPKKKE
ncbi:hypothetical protein OPS25_00340 [Alteromonas ponticola]|uniref:Uncharacterized protein n=1 Tax=Alteromonas aquimaris TaxID=2998417 RepID=A0ABT3P2H0_9ALTE|nr:hypothetical protein [Alteromonas aquimaris]MCW8106948.1 hypothetical protein [Alteromonas aquimaris]